MKSKIQIPNAKIKKNVLLKNHTTFRIGGIARYFYFAKEKKDLIEVIKAAKKLKLPFFILGGGSNLLVSDKGFKGLVVNFQFSIFNFQNYKIIAGAGTPLGKLVIASLEKNLTGLEWAAGIPGTVGGAIFGNAGAFGKSMADIVKSVEVLEIIGNKNQNAKFKNQNDKSKFKIRKLKNRECNFGYRNSIFKQNKNLIILSAMLQLKKGDKKEIKKKIQENLNYRKEKQPLNFPSAGSVFKNPAGFFAGKLIDDCGLKGKKIGQAQISKKHANFIVNLGGAKAKDVIKLIKLAKQKVKNKFKIVLEEEIEIIHT